MCNKKIYSSLLTSSITIKHLNLIYCLNSKLDDTNKPGEWSVLYHGTVEIKLKTIVLDGYDLTKEKRFVFGYGVYSTLDINATEKYPIKLSHESGQYLVVLQNRMNPARLIKIPADRTAVSEYWISPSNKDVLPYGICNRKL